MSKHSPYHDQAIAAALKFAHEALKVEPWAIKSPSRLAYIVQARALVCLILKAEGLTLRQIAPAVGMSSASSAHELIKRYRNHKATGDLLGQYMKGDE